MIEIEDRCLQFFFHLIPIYETVLETVLERTYLEPKETSERNEIITIDLSSISEKDNI